MDALISNAWGRVPYNITRSLARRGLRVVVGTDHFSGMAALSRYAAATFTHPVATIESAVFVESIQAALRRFSPKVYLPTGEETYIIAKYIDALPSTAVSIPIAPYQTIKTLHKKDEVIRLAASLDIPVPDTVRPASAADIRAFCRDHGSRAVLKRISSSSAIGVSPVTEASLGKIAEQQLTPDALQSYVVQEYVHGTGYGVSMLFNRGQLRATFTHKRLAEVPSSGGASVLRMSAVQPALERYARRLLESVAFHGVAMVEFKHNEETGESWLLEVNPRFWGSLALAIRSGVDFPWLLYRMATEGDVDPVLTYQSGVVMKWLLGDLASRMKGLLAPDRPSGRRPKAAGHDDFAWDDLAAFLGNVLLTAWKQISVRTWPHDWINVNIERLDGGEAAGRK